MAWMMMGRQPAFMATKFHVQSKAKNSKKAISCLVIVFVIPLIIAPKTCRKRKQLFTARSLPVFCISPNARDIDISAVIKVMRNSTNVFIDMHFHKRNEVVKNAVFSWQSLMLSWEAGVSQLRWFTSIASAGVAYQSFAEIKWDKTKKKALEISRLRHSIIFLSNKFSASLKISFSAFSSFRERRLGNRHKSSPSPF